MKGKYTLPVLLLVFVLLAAGIVAAGGLLYRGQQDRFQTEVEHKLAAVADLKASELSMWRKDCWEDAGIFYKNSAFSALVRHSIERPQDSVLQKELQTWLGHIQAKHQYDRVALLDAAGNKWISCPNAAEPLSSASTAKAREVLRSGQLTFEDFRRNENTKKVYLRLFVPILDGPSGGRPLGVVMLRIDPEVYLYPFIQRWPTPSATAETLLIRREGNEAVFLNELKFQKNTALALRVPLDNIDRPAVKAALGQEGIVEGVDYRGVPVLAAVRAVPDSPWFLVAHMDAAEVYAPMREQLWLTVLFVSALLFGTAAAVGFLWRQQHLSLYREKYETEHKYCAIIEASADGILMADVETRMLMYPNPALCRMLGYTERELNTMAVADILQKDALHSSLAEFERLARDEGKGLAQDIPCLHKDGTVISVDINTTNATIGGRKCLVGVFRDITERKRAEQTQRQLVAILEATPDFVGFASAKDGHIVYMNSAGRKMLGIGQDEDVTKLKISDVHPDWTNTMLSNEILPAATKDSLWKGECAFLSRDGREIPVLMVLLAHKSLSGEVEVFSTISQDITEQERAEEALRESEEWYKTLFVEALDGISLVDAETGLIIDCNQALTALVGRDKAELIGQPQTILHPPAEDNELFSPTFKQHLGDQAGQVLDTQVVTRTGEIKEVAIRARILNLAGKKVMQGLFRDITDRKRAEKRSELDEARANTLLELSQMTDRPAAEIANHAMESAIKLTGSTIGYIAFANEDETVLTMHYWSKIAMQECAMIEKPIVYLVKDTGLWGEPIRQRKPVITNDYAAPNPLKRGFPPGHTHLTRHMNIPVFDGGRIVAVAGVGNKPQNYEDDDVRQLTLFMDGMWRILCRKRAEEALAKSEDQLRLLLNSTAEAIYGVDIQGCCTFCNPACLRLLGYEHPDELLGKNMHDQIHHSRPDGNAYPVGECRIFQAFQKKEDTHADDEVLWRKDGTSFPAEYWSHPQWRDGNVVGAVVAFVDIADRKQMEDDLRKAKDNAEAANRAKSQFLANMSHEIRTPMTAILGFTDLLCEDIMCCTVCDAYTQCQRRRTGREAVDTIQRNGEHLLGVINDILDLSKIEAEKLQIERTRCSPVELVAEVVSMMRVRAAAKHLELKTELAGPLPENVLTDPLRLRQVLVNLVGNAIKFTDQGEIRLAVRLISDCGPPRLCFDVTDTGVGMDEEQVGKLFRPFTQVDSSPTRRFGGTGLGLCISKHLAEALGGNIEVRSGLGTGSTFTVTIDPGPLDGIHMIRNAQESLLDCPPTAIVATPEKIALQGRILLAEDGMDNQRLIATLLRKAGAEVTAVENGQLAVEAALAAREAGKPFDVILMDIQMPVMDGYEATRQLRTRGYTAPIVALTANAMAEDSRKCLDAGCNDYAAKPIDRERLLTTVARWAALGRTHYNSPNLSAIESKASTTMLPASVYSHLAADPDLGELVDLFVQEMPDRIDALDAQAKRRDWKQLAQTAHQLKGAAGSYGFDEITPYAARLEAALRESQQEDQILSALDELVTFCRRVRAGKPQADETSLNTVALADRS